LLATTEIAAMPQRKPARPETMPVAKPSPAPKKRAPEPEPEELEALTVEPESPALAAEEASSPDWLEPLSPMPDDVKEETTPKGVALELDAPGEAELDLEEVVAEDTQTPARTRVSLAPPADSFELAEPEPEPEADEDEVALGADEDDDGDVSLGALMRESDSTAEEEAVLAELGPATADAAAELEDLAPVRRTPPVAKPAPRPVTPAKPAPVTPAKPAPAKPAAAAKPTPAKPAPAKPAPAKPSPAIPSNGDDSFDLRNLMAEEDTAPSGVLTPPAKDDDDDLDALFDEIQIGDK
jgi:hypothetical protein